MRADCDGSAVTPPHGVSAARNMYRPGSGSDVAVVPRSGRGENIDRGDKTRGMMSPPISPNVRYVNGLVDLPAEHRSFEVRRSIHWNGVDHQVGPVPMLGSQTPRLGARRTCDRTGLATCGPGGDRES